LVYGIAAPLQRIEIRLHVRRKTNQCSIGFELLKAANHPRNDSSGFLSNQLADKSRV
jgi:hypothetical protein